MTRLCSRLSKRRSRQLWMVLALLISGMGAVLFGIEVSREAPEVDAVLSGALFVLALGMVFLASRLEREARESAEHAAKMQSRASQAHDARDAAATSLRLFKEAVEQSRTGIVISEASSGDRPIIYVNPAFESMTGYSRDEVLGKDCRFLNRHDRAQPGLTRLRHALEAGQPCTSLLRNFRKDDTPFWNEVQITPMFDSQGVQTHLIGIQSDVTERENLLEDERRRALRDELTGLPNRRALQEILARRIAASPGALPPLGLVMLNIDRLHQINDTLGMAVGDAAIRGVADRLAAVASMHDARLAKVNGDEFVLISSEKPERADASALASAVAASVRLPLEAPGQRLHLTGSIGVSYLHAQTLTPEKLIAEADLAVRRAKQAGRNRTVVMTEALSSQIASRLHMGTCMREAIQQKQFHLVFQPIVDARQHSIVACESLMRWTSPSLGRVPPDQFIPVAEDSGMIAELGAWALDEAVAQARAIIDAGLPATPIAVNVSSVEFQRMDFVESVQASLARHSLDPRLLKLEITESLIMENADESISMLQRLRAIGVRISVDDFGTGYSSLGYLRKLPLDELKIDRAFICDVIGNPDAASLCRSIIQLGRQMRLAVVAEGVENEEQAHFLRHSGCRYLQGYAFSRPIDAGQLHVLLGTNNQKVLPSPIQQS